MFTQHIRRSVGFSSPGQCAQLDVPATSWISVTRFRTNCLHKHASLLTLCRTIFEPDQKCAVVSRSGIHRWMWLYNLAASCHAISSSLSSVSCLNGVTFHSQIVIVNVTLSWESVTATCTTAPYADGLAPGKWGLSFMTLVRFVTVKTRHLNPIQLLKSWIESYLSIPYNFWKKIPKSFKGRLRTNKGILILGTSHTCHQVSLGVA